jgi:hypothetical protein
MLPLNCVSSCVIQQLTTFKTLSREGPFCSNNYNDAVDIVNMLRAGRPRD